MRGLTDEEAIECLRRQAIQPKYFSDPAVIARIEAADIVFAVYMDLDASFVIHGSAIAREVFRGRKSEFEPLNFVVLAARSHGPEFTDLAVATNTIKRRAAKRILAEREAQDRSDSPDDTDREL